MPTNWHLNIATPIVCLEWTLMNESILSAFDTIRIISLPDRTDRRADVIKELGAYQLVPGRGRVRFFDAIRPDSAGGFPSVGARGCYLSHLEVLRQARADNVHRLLVLEDDAMFLPALAKSTDILPDFLKDEWDLVYPGHFLEPEPGALRWISAPQSVLCTHAYAVNQRVISKLIHALEVYLLRPPGDPLGGPMHLDAAYNTFRTQHPEIITLRTSQALIVQRSSESDVSGPSRAQSILPSGILKVGRKIKSWLRRG